jgi:uncharacterized OB-fold protein
MNGPLAEFLAFLRSGKFMLQRRIDNGQFVFYPRYIPGTATEWTEASGNGTVYSRTIVRQKAEQGGDYCVALVDLDEGPRMIARVAGNGVSVEIGAKVQAVVAEPDWDWTEGPVILFRLAARSPEVLQ